MHGMAFDRGQCMGVVPPEETRVRVRVFRISVYVRVVMVLHRDQCMG